jgi:FkbH-like protein
MAVIRSHPNMILKEHHFAAMRINWKEKTDNIRELAEELNVGTDSMVFLDDSQTNREAMRAFVPEVETPELPEDPQMYTKFLNSLPYFESNVTTDEDKMRGNLYVTERLRKESEKEFSDHGEFLKSLRTELQMYEDVPTALPRLSQLTEKTNQFNTKKTPMTVKEIQDYIFSPEHVIFYASASDRFGDHGIIAFAVVQKEKEQAQK